MSSTVAPSRHSDHWFDTDAGFHHLYPVHIQLLAAKHWTPLHIIKRVAQYLVPADHVRVLDIGSGVGKFCLTAAHCMPSATFFGVEQRKELVEHAENGRKILGLPNTHFINCNFTQLDFRKYDHFYFYNSFYENLVSTNKIDDSIAYSTELFDYYNRYLYRKLDKMPAGTRIVTYHSLDEEIPPGYHLVETQLEYSLKFWIKVDSL